jgi:hypothetical protein
MKRCDGYECSKAAGCAIYHQHLSEPHEPIEEPDADWCVIAGDLKTVINCRDYKKLETEVAK